MEKHEIFLLKSCKTRAREFQPELFEKYIKFNKGCHIFNKKKRTERLFKFKNYTARNLCI